MDSVPDLDHLVGTVGQQAGSDDPLERLAVAVRLRDQLDALADAVLDHFVGEARQAGCSWSRIGAVLGVSKQAAQQRHTAEVSTAARRLLDSLAAKGREAVTGAFRRFRPEARQAVVRAQEEARALGHDHIGPEHLLLGLLHDRDSTASDALAPLGLFLDGVRGEVERLAGTGTAPVSGHIPYTDEAKRALEQSLRESKDLGHDDIRPEHILLALLRTASRPAPGSASRSAPGSADGTEAGVHRLLAAFGTDPARALAIVLERLEGQPGHGS